MKREIISMDRGWKFQLGDVPYDKYMGHGILYMASKTESSKGAGRRDYDDSSWRVLDIPHDYVVEGTPTHEEPGSHGSLPRPNAWYRKTFKLAQEDNGKRIALHFEGVCTACQVHVNGQIMMRNYTAGVGFDVDITDIARYGEDVNVVAVHVDNSEFEGWYYEGSGLYRHVWLIMSGKVYVDLWGTCIISTPVHDDVWDNQIRTEIKNINDEGKVIRLLSEIVNAEGKVVASVVTETNIPAHTLQTIEQNVKVSDVMCWDIDDPNLYTLRTTILSDSTVEDTYETSFGYRTIEYTANDGFLLNGRKVFINGYGSHQDLTGFGIGMTDSVIEYKMHRLKSMGFNLFRTAHNPHAPCLYDSCDKIGLLCMDENRWYSSSPEVKDEVICMIKRDRNHPSIIMWSLFNEEKNRVNYIGRNIMRSLSALAHQYDPTRPAFGCDDSAQTLPCALDYDDIIGINHLYDFDRLDVVRKNYPNKPIFFSEEGLTDDIRHYCETRPYIFGAVGWGGLPYQGETMWPQLFSGRPDRYIFSLLCDPEDLFYKNKAQWTDIPVVKITSHWTYPGKEGEAIPVVIFSNMDKAELFLNGRSLGVKHVDRSIVSAQWDVLYEAGELKVVATADGKPDLTDKMVTVGVPASIELRLENPGVCANNHDTAIITALVMDEQGRELPFSENYLLRFRVNKGGRFLCVGSPNRGDHESWQIPQIHMCCGKAQVYVECSADSDPLEVEVLCDNFAPASVVIDKVAGEVIREVPGEDTYFLYKWYVSPTLINQSMPDIEELRRIAGENGWMNHEVGRGNTEVPPTLINQPMCDIKELHNSIMDKKGWMYHEVGRGNTESFTGLFPRPPMTVDIIAPESARLIYCTKQRIPHNAGTYKKLMLVFEKYEGAGTVWLFSGDKRIEARKGVYNSATFIVDATELTPGDEIEVWTVLEANTNFCGIIKPVHWMYE